MGRLRDRCVQCSQAGEPDHSDRDDLEGPDPHCKGFSFLLGDFVDGHKGPFDRQLVHANNVKQSTKTLES